ncbi:MAG TPA: hypothetical protein VK864_07365, partial [Longimicrobiales bacterium]|nr:hypothetical protein [Longimicrobiales bacterium]
MSLNALEDVRIFGDELAAAERVLTPEAVAFVAWLHQEFETRRRDLLRQRDVRQAELRLGQLPDFLGATARVRASDWQVAPTPPDLQDRRVE